MFTKQVTESLFLWTFLIKGVDPKIQNRFYFLLEFSEIDEGRFCNTLWTYFWSIQPTVESNKTIVLAKDSNTLILGAGHSQSRERWRISNSDKEKKSERDVCNIRIGRIIRSFFNSTCIAFYCSFFLRKESTSKDLFEVWQNHKVESAKNLSSKHMDHHWNSLLADWFWKRNLESLKGGSIQAFDHVIWQFQK